jgi:hypothetical protein
MPPIFDFGAALEGGLGAHQSALGQQQGSAWMDMLGGGLGGTVANTSGGLTGEITLSGIQQMMSQIIFTPSNGVVYYGGIDWGSTVSTSAVTTVTYPVIPETIWQYQYQYQNVMMGALGNVVYQQAAQTPEQRAAWVKSEAERAAKKDAATKRAENLLFTILKPEQVRQYEDHGYFETEIDDRIYRIHKRSHSANVELIVKGKPVAKYCAHPANAYETPVMDTMISQLLALKTDEARFLRTANKTVLHQ